MLNGWLLVADDADCAMTMWGLEAGELGEAEFAAWLRQRSIPA